MDRLTDFLDMTLVVGWAVKSQHKQTKCTSGVSFLMHDVIKRLDMTSYDKIN